MARRLVYQDVPPPQEDDPATIITSLNAVRQNVQALTGELTPRNQAGGAQSSGAVCRSWCYRKTKASDPEPVGYIDGDQWHQPPVLPGDAWIHLIWYQGQWVPMSL